MNGFENLEPQMDADKRRCEIHLQRMDKESKDTQLCALCELCGEYRIKQRKEQPHFNTIFTCKLAVSSQPQIFEPRRRRTIAKHA